MALPLVFHPCEAMSIRGQNSDAVCPKSFRPQRDHRIDAGGAQGGDGGERHEVKRAHAIQLTAQQLSGGGGAEQTGDQTDDDGRMPSRATSRMISPGPAPRASRMPISRVRWLT